MPGETPLTRAIRKRKAKERLSAEEEAALREHSVATGQRASRIYFDSKAQLDEYQSLARAAGYNSFSKWVRSQLDCAVSGETFDPEYVDQLRVEVTQLRADLERERDHTEEYRTRCRALESKLEEYADEFFRIAAKGTP